MNQHEEDNRMKILLLIKQWWQENTGNYKTFSISPTWLLLFYVASASFVSFSLAALLTQVLPSYYQVAIEVPFASWGWQGWHVTTMIVIFAIVTWLATNVAVRCNKIILERHFQ